jgi:L-threonylcarbamoyladenylate synthase
MITVKVQSSGVAQGAMLEVAAVAKAGGVIAYPTETVYGLGGDPVNAGVVDRIRGLKGRDSEKSFLLLVAPGWDVGPHVASVPDAALRLMQAFWPGPLTLVFKASPAWPCACLGKGGTVAFRCSPDPAASALCAALASPLISTSANPAGLAPARSAAEVLRYFPQGLDAVVDGGERGMIAPSTVVDVTGPEPVVLRPGPVGIKQILDAVRGQARVSKQGIA